MKRRNGGFDEPDGKDVPLSKLVARATGIQQLDVKGKSGLTTRRKTFLK